MADGVIARFVPDRRTYIRDHVIIAVFGTVAVALVLIFMGNPDPWVALIAAPLAVGVRGVYLASDDLVATWELSDSTLTGPGRSLPLAEIATVRRLGSAAQVIMQNGDKHLIKYLADPGAVAAKINETRA
jgi:asparagine N-glycosylation enzyme membrane subunit Stt3